MDFQAGCSRRPDPSTLAPDVRSAWARLGGLPGERILCGETALSMWLGRASGQDFEFVSAQPFVPDRLLDDLRGLTGCELKEKVEDPLLTTSLTVTLPEGVDARFTCGLPSDRRHVNPPAPAPGGGLVASVADILARKCYAVQPSAGRRRDYVDIWDIIDRTGCTLSDGLAFMVHVFENAAAPHETLAGLTYQANLGDALPAPVRTGLLTAVRGVDIRSLAARLYGSGKG